MKTFTIDSDLHITAHASDEEAADALPPTGAHVFSTAAGLKAILKQFPAATTIDIWNGLTGVTPVKKFQDSSRRRQTDLHPATVARRRSRTSQLHQQNACEESCQVRREERQSPEDSRERASCDKQDRPTDRDAAAAQRRNARRGHGAVRVQIHTTRAIMSAGGSLTKKHGITVLSERVGEVRTYRVKQEGPS